MKGGSMLFFFAFYDFYCVRRKFFQCLIFWIFTSW